MEKRNRIIVLIDFSEHTENLVDFAFRASDIINAKVVFLHQILGFVPSLAANNEKDKFHEVEINEAREKLTSLAQERVHGSPSMIVSPKPVRTLIMEMQSSNYLDWVIGGLKESSLIKRILFGSTLVTLINNSALLTVAVPIRHLVEIPKKLIIAVTHKYELNKPQLEILLSAFKNQIKAVEFLTILQEDDNDDLANKYLFDLQQRYAAYNTSILILKGADKNMALKHHLEQNKQYFLVLQEGGRSFLDELFRKYLINDIIHAGNIPLIVLSK
ncbi:universal stress protein [Paucihalobacter sp.]|uniref:universal stress protein n=1 Tax=Paucihalobacter sp. TaxID=2850405 RepID=UPI002FE33998